MSTLLVRNLYQIDPNSKLSKMCSSRQRCKFTLQEDRRLSKLVRLYGERNWEIIADLMRGRSVRQCRERWQHYLSPNVLNLPWTQKEDELLEKKFAEYGSSWKKIAEFFPNRNYIQLRNRYLLKQRRSQKLSKRLFVALSKISYPLERPKEPPEKDKKNNIQVLADAEVGQKQCVPIDLTPSSSDFSDQPNEPVDSVFADIESDIFNDLDSMIIF